MNTLQIKQIIESSEVFKNYVVDNYNGMPVSLSQLSWYPTRGLLQKIGNIVPPFGASLFRLKHDNVESLINPDTIYSVQDNGTYNFMNQATGKYININHQFFGPNTFNIKGDEIIAIINSHKISVCKPMTKKFYIELVVTLLAIFNKHDPNFNHGNYVLNDLNKHSLTINTIMNLYPEFKLFITRVESNPSQYDLDDNMFTKLLLPHNGQYTRTLYELGCMVIHTVNTPIMTKNNKLRQRNIYSADYVVQVDVTGIRNFKTHFDFRKDYNINEKETLNQYVELMENNYYNMIMHCANVAEHNFVICLPAIGMGVWRGPPNIYWKALKRAIKRCNNNILGRFKIVVNPCGNHKNKYWESLIKLPTIIPTNDRDIIDIASNLKENTKYVVFIVNASDPDRTLLGELAGQYSNNGYNVVKQNGTELNFVKSHSTTTEEHYCKLNIGAYLSSEYITKTVTKNPNRIFEN